MKKIENPNKTKSYETATITSHLHSLYFFVWKVYEIRDHNPHLEVFLILHSAKSKMWRLICI